MVSATGWILVMLCVCAVCTFASPKPLKPRISKAQVIAIAQRAIAAKFPWTGAKHYRYDALLGDDGIWGVYVPHPERPAMVGGGDPNAEVTDRDGKVLKIYFAK